MRGDDVGGMEAFFRKTEVAVTRCARRLGGVLSLSDELVEDAIQSAYEVAFRKWVQLSNDEQFLQRSDGLVGWMCVTVRNKVLFEYRNQQKFIELNDNIDVPDPNLDVAMNVVDDVTHIERFTCLRRALKIASPSVAEVVALYLSAEGVHADRLRTVADYQNISVDATRKRFERAIRALRRIMSELDGGPEGGVRGHE